MTLLLFRGPNHLTRASHCVVAPGAKTQLGGLRGGSGGDRQPPGE